MFRRVRRRRFWNGQWHIFDSFWFRDESYLLVISTLIFLMFDDLFLILFNLYDLSLIFHFLNFEIYIFQVILLIFAKINLLQLIFYIRSIHHADNFRICNGKTLIPFFILTSLSFDRVFIKLLIPCCTILWSHWSIVLAFLTVLSIVITWFHSNDFWVILIVRLFWMCLGIPLLTELSLILFQIDLTLCLHFVTYFRKPSIKTIFYFL